MNGSSRRDDFYSGYACIHVPRPLSTISSMVCIKEAPVRLLTKLSARLLAGQASIRSTFKRTARNSIRLINFNQRVRVYPGSKSSRWQHTPVFTEHSLRVHHVIQLPLSRLLHFPNLLQPSRLYIPLRRRSLPILISLNGQLPRLHIPLPSILLLNAPLQIRYAPDPRYLLAHAHRRHIRHQNRVSAFMSRLR